MNMNRYRVTLYDIGRDIEVTRVIDARTARDAVEAAREHHFPRSFSAEGWSRWQGSPSAADRDNLHVQFDSRGLRGIAALRAETDQAAAQHRSDVAVARQWVADGHTLADLQRYGSYRSVTEVDLATGQ